MSQLILTAVGRDRPGLVGDLTGALFAAGANLADSRMVNLRGQFALVVLLEASDEVLAGLRPQLPAMAEKMGLTITLAGQGAAPERSAGLAFRLKTYSMDQPGIVHRVSDLLRKHHVNIEELETRLESAPFMGSPIFTMELRMHVPAQTRVPTLRKELEAVCEELNCDFDLEPA
jgi:glycine cleavage system transcriptional repressor